MQLSAAALAHLLQGTITGDPEVVVHNFGKIEEAGPGELSFLSNPKYESYLYETGADIVLVATSFAPSRPVSATLIHVEDVYGSLARLLEQFQQSNRPAPGQSATAVVAETASVGAEVHLGHFVIVEDGAQIGEGCTLYPHVFIGKNVKLGKNVTLHSGVKIYEGCSIGDNCVLHANVVVGADGFGFAPQTDGTYRKFPQVGHVIIGDEVEIGANSTIDRGSMGPTVIGRGTKIDNLVMIAHNVQIGEHTVIAAQAGIAGSTKIGSGVQIGGQAGFVGHIEIADGVKVQAQSGINRSIKEKGTAVYGSPAIAYRDYLKSYALFRRLPEMRERLDAVVRQLKEEMD